MASAQMAATGRGRQWPIVLGIGLLTLVLTGIQLRSFTNAPPRRAIPSGRLAPPASVVTSMTPPRREPLPSLDATSSAASATAVAVERPPAATLTVTTAAPTRGSFWAERALCGAGSPKVSEWVRYLQGFRDVQVDKAVLHADFTVETRELERTARLIRLARSVVQQETRLEVQPPEVYVHRDVATLRKYSCVAGNVVAFYDGALHVADVASDQKLRGELWFSIVHEYTHHALLSHGVREPIWFQEGLAMHVSREPWRNFDITPPGFDMREMADGFPHAATPESAERFYGQAYQMLEFLRGLCQAEWDCGYPALVGELRRGAAPGTFFQDTIARLAPRSSAPPLELWRMYFAGLRPPQ